MTTKNTPALRFLGFTDAWEKRQLGEVGEIERKSINPKDFPDRYFDEYSMPAFDMNRAPNRVKGRDMLSSRLKLTSDSLLINKLNVRQKRIWLIRNPSKLSVSSPEFLPFVSKDIDLEYVKSYFLSDSTTRYLEDISTGSSNSQKRVTPKDIVDLKIPIPTHPEQTAIGNFFAQLDRAIALQERKCQTVKNLKKTLLKKMFPENDANMPALRFSGFTDAWEKRQLGEVASMYSGGTPSITRREYYGGTIPFIRSAEINSNETELFLSEEGLKNSSAKLVNIGDLLYALYGATSGEVGISKIKGAINQAVLAIIPNEDFNSLFISQWLVTEKNNITEKYLQGGQGNLSGTIVKQLEVSFPTHPEQTSIGTFFSQLDRAIALQEKKLENMKMTKKTLLKLMFI